MNTQSKHSEAPSWPRWLNRIVGRLVFLGYPGWFEWLRLPKDEADKWKDRACRYGYAISPVSGADGRFIGWDCPNCDGTGNDPVEPEHGCNQCDGCGTVDTPNTQSREPEPQSHDSRTG